MIFSDTESFILLVGALLPLLHCSCLPLHASRPTSITAEFHGAAPQEPRNVRAYTKLLLILLEEYCSRLAWLFFQIHSANLKVTTLSSSSAFLFDNCGSRMKQCDYLPDTEHKLTANRHVITTSFRLWKNALGMLLIFNKQWDKLLFSDCPDISSSWLPLYSTSFEMLMLSSPFSIQEWKFLPCGLGLRRKMEVLLNPWLVLFILCFSLILFSKLLF